MITSAEREERTIQILMKGWDTFQSLAKANGESAWNLRAWGLTAWAALIAYAYSNNKIEIIIVAMITLTTVFFIELAIRQIQYQYIKKSIAIEYCINDILVGDQARMPDGGISTNIETPSIKDFFALFEIKRWLIWFPYVLLITFSFIAFKNF